VRPVGLVFERRVAAQMDDRGRRAAPFAAISAEFRMQPTSLTGKFSAARLIAGAGPAPLERARHRDSKAAPESLIPTANTPLIAIYLPQSEGKLDDNYRFSGPPI
jgi:hypothetical protein